MRNLYPKLSEKISGHTLKSSCCTSQRYFVKLSFAIVLIAIASPGKLFAQVPSISYGSPQTYTAGTAILALTPTSSGVAAPGYSSSLIPLGSGFNGPNGVAIDAAGDVYVADYGNNVVWKIPAGGGDEVTIGTGFTNPTGVAVDAAGNVYVADSNTNSWPYNPNGGVYEILAANGSTVSIGAGFTGAQSNPRGVAVDGAGNVYVSDAGNSAVKKILAAGGGTVTIGSISGPQSLAVDATGNVYVATGSGAAIMMIPAGSGGIPVTVGSGFLNPYGIAVDGAGNVYVADGGNGAIKEIPAGGGSIATIVSGFSNPYGIAADATGNLYITDQVNNIVREINPVGGYYISPFLPAGLSFNSATGVISGTPAVASPATNYTVTAYNSSGLASAKLSITVNLPALPAISYSGPQTYTKGSAITALTPTSSRVSAPGYSSKLAPLGSGFYSPRGVAVDAAGNVYEADATTQFWPNSPNGSVNKVPAGGGSTVSIGTGFNSPAGVAADAAGNVYVADNGANQVYEIPAGGGATKSFGSGFNGPAGIATDAAGNVYVANNGNGDIIKIASGGAQATLGTVSGAISLAVDASGNVYVATGSGSTTIMMIAAGGTGNAVVAGSGFSNPTGVAVDAAGNVYVVDQGNNVVKEIPAGGGSILTIASGLSNPYGIAIDAAGNLYVSCQGNNTIMKVKPSGGYYISPFLPAGLSYNTATGAISGTPTAVTSPTNYTATAYNNFGSKSANVNIAVTANTPTLPSISYGSPQTYTAGTAILALTPTSSGVAAPGYSSSLIPLGSGFNGPNGVAIDAAGDVYVADYGNNVVWKIPAGGGDEVTIGTGFTNPTGVAVDAAGNVYVADSNTNSWPYNPNGGVYEILAANGSTVSIGAGFTGAQSNPRGVAVDGAGNVYVSDAGNSAVKKILAAGGGTVTIGSISGPQSLAVDATGNVYVATGSGAAIMMIPAGSGGIPVTVGSGFLNPYGIAVDGAGNVYVADGGNGAIKEIPAGGGSIATIVSGFSNPYGIAADATGNLYITDQVNNIVREINPVGGYYISPFLPAGLSFNSATGVISGTPAVASPATNYTVTAYNSSGLASAKLSITVNLPALPAISYSGPQTYTKGSAITALTPTSSRVSAPGYSSKLAPLGSGFYSPRGVAVDAAGNVYEADATTQFWPNSPNGSVNKVPAGGGSTVSIGTGFNSPAGVAADAAGNVYVADNGANQVYEIPAGGGATKSFGSGFNGPAGIATDAAGNVYVANNGNGDIIKIASGGAQATLGTVSGAISLAVDASGNVYVATGSGSTTIMMIAAGGTGNAVVAGSGFSNPTGVAVDAAGNVYVVDQGNNVVKEIPAGGGSILTIASGLSNPYGIAIDAAGNLYVSCQGNNTIMKVKPSGGYYISPFLPAGLSYNTATGAISGTPTAVTSPTNYTATAYNNFGSKSATVNIVVGYLAFPAIPAQAYGSPDYTPAATSIYPITYTSSDNTVATIVSGNIHITGAGTVTITATDGHTTLSQPLTVTPVPLTITATNATKIYGAAYPPFTATYSGLVNGDTPASLPTLPTFSTASASSSVGTYTLTPGGAVDKNYVIGYVSGSFSITPAALTISAISQNKNYGAALPGLTLNYSGLVNGDTPSSLTTQPNITTTATQSSPAGSYPINVSGAVDANYTISYIAGTLTVNQAALTITAVSKTKTYGAANPALTITYSGFVNSDSQSSLTTAPSITTTATQSSPASTYPITTNGAVDANYFISYVSGTLTITPASLVITANSISKGYGTPLTGGPGSPAFTSTGLQNSETIGSVTIAYGTGSAVNAPVGTYTGSVTASAPTGGTFTASNYTITYAAGNITVSAAPLTITANNVNKNYGIALTGGPGSVAFTSSALQNSETIGSVTIAYGTGSAANAAVGAYTGSITASAPTGGTFTASNYAITYSKGIIVVEAVPLTITANNVTKYYGIALTGGTGSTGFTTAGLQNSETIGSVTIAYGAGSSATAAAGTYTGSVTASAATGGTFAAGNYTINYDAGDITALPLTLSALTLSSGTLSPVFEPSATNYTTSVPNSVALVTETPTIADPSATVTVNGTIVTSGSASGPLTLNVGSNKIITIVTASDGVTKKTYTVTVIRESGNDNLSALTLSSGSLSPAFASGTKTYTATVANNVASVTVTPTTSDPSATGVTVNGITVTSGTASGPVALNVGTNTITVIVTAHDPSFTKTYTVTITRESGNDNLSALTISSVTLSPVFASTVKTYTASVGYGVSSVMVTPTTTDPSATGVTVNGKAVKSGTASGAVALSAGQNTITVIVTAHDPSFTKTYTVTVTRAPSTNAVLSGLSISAGTLNPAFATETTSYSASVGNGVTSLMVTPTTSNSGATVTVNGMAVTSGSASGPVTLNVGSNTITTIVTAQDGVTTKTYTITVTRAPSANAILAKLIISAGTLSPAFATETTSYTASVGNGVTSVTVTPTTSNSGATVTVNGMAVTSGSASGPVALNVGSNAITTIVTAQDGVTTKTYTITITRESGSDNTVYQPVSVETPADSPQLADDGIIVHRGVSPNGDGIDDFLQIDNITSYPDNRLMIMNRNGILVYEVKGYDNISRIFDGHSNKTGQMQLPGTYFYSLDYTVKGIAKHKTGFLVLKY